MTTYTELVDKNKEEIFVHMLTYSSYELSLRISVGLYTLTNKTGPSQVLTLIAHNRGSLQSIKSIRFNCDIWQWLLFGPPCMQIHWRYRYVFIFYLLGAFTTRCLLCMSIQPLVGRHLPSWWRHRPRPKVTWHRRGVWSRHLAAVSRRPCLSGPCCFYRSPSSCSSPL